MTIYYYLKTFLNNISLGALYLQHKEATKILHPHKFVNTHKYTDLDLRKNVFSLQNATASVLRAEIGEIGSPVL